MNSFLHTAFIACAVDKEVSLQGAVSPSEVGKGRIAKSYLVASYWSASRQNTRNGSMGRLLVLRQYYRGRRG